MSKIGPFIVGSIVGAVGALLLAPRTGEEARALVSEKANAVWGEGVDFIGGAGAGAQDAYKAAQERGAAAFQNVAASAQEFAKNAQAQAGEAIEAATARVKEITGAEAPAEEAAPAYSGDGDELRQKIEAARQRIAAQVMANAEQSNIPMAQPLEAVAETVEEAAEEVAEAAAEAVEEVAEAVAEAAEEAKAE